MQVVCEVGEVLLVEVREELGARRVQRGVHVLLHLLHQVQALVLRQRRLDR